MIGGTDIIIPTQAGTAALDLSARLISRDWPEAVFEHAETSQRAETYQGLQFSGVSELLIYKNMNTAKAWGEKGAVPELSNTMIHLLVSAESLTAVVDDPNADDMKLLIDSIRHALHVGNAIGSIECKEAA